jgi:hypothetical protein
LTHYQYESESESEDELEYESHSACCAESKAKWLYNTGSSDYITNSKACFTSYKPFKKGKEGSLKTGGGTVIPIGKGTVVLQVLQSQHQKVYSNITLRDVLYIPAFPLNIISGQRHYASGGFLAKNTLMNAASEPIAVLNPSEAGFFVSLKNEKKGDPSAAVAIYQSYKRASNCLSESFPVDLSNSEYPETPSIGERELDENTTEEGFRSLNP